MLHLCGIFRRPKPSTPALACVPAHPSSLPTPAPTRRSRAFVFGVATYFTLLLAAHVSGSVWLDDAAVLVLVSVFLLTALRRGSALAWLAWLVVAAVLVALGATGKGRVAVDGMPVLINVALCGVFARTLRGGREPLIARIIAIIEGPARLALPGVSDYARRLTQAWAWLFGVQAAVLLVLVACAARGGWLVVFGLQPPIAIGDGWRWYLHLGSFALVAIFLVLEYAFRRWYLRAISHPSLAHFIARLARCWPALVRSFAEDAHSS